MRNELSAWALIWKVFCAEFAHWCPSDTQMSQSLFHPLLHQGKKLDSILPNLRNVTEWLPSRISFQRARAER